LTLFEGSLDLGAERLPSGEIGCSRDIKLARLFLVRESYHEFNGLN
jgi:hypothetical protein